MEIYPARLPVSYLEGVEEEQRNVLLVKFYQCCQAQALLPDLLAELSPKAPPDLWEMRTQHCLNRFAGGEENTID